MTQGGKEVKISFESFLDKEVQDALHWNREIGSKIMFGSKTGKYFCKECSFWDNQKPNIVNHVELKHLAGFPGYSCVLCQHVFQTWFIFKSHVKKDHCSDSAETRKSLQRLHNLVPKVPKLHIQKQQASKPEFVFKEKIKERIKEVKKRDIPKKVSKLKPLMPKPIKEETLSFYVCVKCDAKYTQRNQLNLHYKVAHNIFPAVDEMSFEIPVYDEDQKPMISKDIQPIPTFETSFAVTQNPKRVKKESQKTPCTYCPKYFTSFSEYAEHEATHAGIYVYNCHLCKGLGFRMEHEFMEHMKTKHKFFQHSSHAINMLRCSHSNTCQRLFLSKQTMRPHVLEDHFTIKTEMTVDKTGSDQTTFKYISKSLKLPTIPVPRQNLSKEDELKNLSLESPQSDLGSVDVDESPLNENSLDESSIQPSSTLSLLAQLDEDISQIDALLESSTAAQETETSSEEYCENDNEDNFLPNDPLAIEPGEVVDDTFKSETFLEETVVMF